MGLNSENAARLVFDIETAPLAEAVDYLDPVEAPSNYKDPLKIDAYKAEKQAENLERAGLDVDLCRIVSICVWKEHEPQPEEPWTTQAFSEQDIVEMFWRAAQSSHLVGFNCIGFDLPVLQRRSLYLDVPMPGIQVDRYRHPSVTDLQQLLSYNGALKLRGLSFYARRFGFDVPDTMTGADIAQAVSEGRWDDVEAHCKADVQKTAMLAAKLGYFNRVTAGAF